MRPPCAPGQAGWHEKKAAATYARLMRPASQAGPGDPAADAGFDAAVADLRAGLDAERPLRPQVTFEDVPAPRRLAPHAAAIAATVRGAGNDEQPDVAWGRLVLLYDPDGQPGWGGQFRVVVYIRADVEPEIAADPLLGTVGWSWLTEALDARAAGDAAATGLELRASWSPAGPPPAAAGAPAHSLTPPPPALAGHVAAWCDALCAAAGLPPAAAGVSALPKPRRP